MIRKRVRAACANAPRLMINNPIITVKVIAASQLKSQKLMKGTGRIKLLS
jgi:hypothetical protein